MSDDLRRPPGMSIMATPFASSSNRAATLRECTNVVRIASFIAVAFSASASKHAWAVGLKYSDIAGYTVEVGWTETWQLRDPNGKERGMTTTVSQAIYLGTREHIFMHITIDGGKILNNVRGLGETDRRYSGVLIMGSL